MQNQVNNKVVIYCRVSSKEQVDEGNSLASQERICREYALKNNYEVARTFIEEGESAKTTNRTQLNKLLAFCTDKKNTVAHVIIHKIDRLSRNTYDYGYLKRYLQKFNISIKSVSENIEDTPSGKLMETMLSSFAQFDNDVRAERCAGGMKDATREGRYVWMAPVGYDNVKVNDKATISPNEKAYLVKETFELIVKGTFATEEVRRMMEAKGLQTRKGKPLVKSYFYNMLKNKTYMGYIEKFGECNKGNFEPIISETTFNLVQRVLKSKSKKMSQYKLDSEDFPLRRFIFSEEGKSLTGSWSRGRSKLYPFYRFLQKGSNYNKDVFEKKFMEEMDRYKFDSNSIAKLKKLLKEKLVKATEGERKEVTRKKARLEELSRKQNLLVEKNLDGVINDEIFKQQITLIENESLDIKSFINSVQENEYDPIELLEFAEEYLKNPSGTWKIAKLEQKVKLQWFEFPSGLIFDGEKFRTTNLANLFKTKDAFSASSSYLVDPTGLEPATSSVQMRRSSQMS